jgi:hypothetical protein
MRGRSKAWVENRYGLWSLNSWYKICQIVKATLLHQTDPTLKTDLSGRVNTAPGAGQLGGELGQLVPLSLLRRTQRSSWPRSTSRPILNGLSYGEDDCSWNKKKWAWYEAHYVFSVNNNRNRGVCSILLRSKYLRRYTSTKLKNFGVFFKFFFFS